MYKVGRLRMYSVLFAAMALQMTIAPYLAIGGVKPDLVIICIILSGIFFGPRAGFEAGLLGGFLQDIFALDFFWTNTFLGVVTGLLSGTVSSQFSKESKSVCVLLVAALCGVSMALHYLVTSLVSPYHALDFFEYLAGTIFPGSIATGIVAIIVLFYFQGIFTIKNGTDLL